MVYRRFSSKTGGDVLEEETAGVAAGGADLTSLTAVVLPEEVFAAPDLFAFFFPLSFEGGSSTTICCLAELRVTRELEEEGAGSGVGERESWGAVVLVDLGGGLTVARNVRKAQKM